MLQTTEAYRRHQFGAVDAPHIAVTCPSRQPDQGHSVGRGQTALVEQSPERRIPAAFHDAVGRRYTNVMALTAGDPLVDDLDRHGHVDRTDADAEDVGSRDI